MPKRGGAIFQVGACDVVDVDLPTANARLDDNVGARSVKSQPLTVSEDLVALRIQAEPNVPLDDLHAIGTRQDAPDHLRTRLCE